MQPDKQINYQMNILLQVMKTVGLDFWYIVKHTKNLIGPDSVHYSADRQHEISIPFNIIEYRCMITRFSLIIIHSLAFDKIVLVWIMVQCQIANIPKLKVVNWGVLRVVPEAGFKGMDQWLHPTDTVGYTNLYLPLIPATGTTLLNYEDITLNTTSFSKKNHEAKPVKCLACHLN